MLIQVVLSPSKVQTQNLHVVDLVPLHWRRGSSMNLDRQLNVDTLADALHVASRPLLRDDHGRGHCQGFLRPSGDMQRGGPAPVALWFTALAAIGTAERRIFGIQGEQQDGRRLCQTWKDEQPLEPEVCDSELLNYQKRWRNDLRRWQETNRKTPVLSADQVEVDDLGECRSRNATELLKSA